MKFQIHFQQKWLTAFESLQKTTYKTFKRLPGFFKFLVIVPCFAHQYRLGVRVNVRVRVCIYVYGGIQLTLQYPLHNVYYIGARNMERLPSSSWVISCWKSVISCWKRVPRIFARCWLIFHIWNSNNSETTWTSLLNI